MLFFKLAFSLAPNARRGRATEGEGRGKDAISFCISLLWHFIGTRGARGCLCRDNVLQAHSQPRKHLSQFRIDSAHMATERARNSAAGQSPPRFVPSTRFLLALLVFFAFVVQYSQRVNVAMAIVCMVNRTQPSNASSVAIAQSRGLPYNATRALTTSAPEQRGFFEKKQFFWDEEKQQDLLGGYWAGYIFTQIPGE